MKLKKKVIAINSSKRKKSTYGLLLQVKNLLKYKDIQVDIINLFDYRINECLGCEMCLRNGSCNIKDDCESLMQMLTEYDGIILSTPVYMNNISGKLKVFIDRTCRWMHRPELTSIPTMFIVSTAASGSKKTLEYLENISLQWGTFATDKICRKVNTLNTPIDIKECNGFIKHILMNKEDYKPSLKQLIHFQVQKILADKVLPKDKEYWEMKGWMDKNYFHDMKINPIKMLTAKTFYKLLYYRIKKVDI